MRPNKDEAALYAHYKSLLDADALDLDYDNPMAAAHAAEQGGDLAFLVEAPEMSTVPARLVTRAVALAPRDSAAPPRFSWRQGLIALGTVLAFGSGSYAVAATFSGQNIATDWSVEEGLFDTAAAGGFFDYE